VLGNHDENLERIMAHIQSALDVLKTHCELHGSPSLMELFLSEVYLDHQNVVFDDEILETSSWKEVHYASEQG
jgi:hypothetical protein